MSENNISENENRGWKIASFAFLKNPPEIMAAIIYTVSILFTLASLIIGLSIFFHSGYDALVEDAENRNEAAKVFFSVLLALVGGPILIWRVLSAHWQAQAARQEAETSREAHYTTLFTKAVEQLGATREILEILPANTGEAPERITRVAPNIEVRVGAIYALERIAHDSERDHWPIMEVLCAYIRENCGIANECPIQISNEEAESGNDEFKAKLTNHKKWTNGLPSPRQDVQAALTVIGRRSKERRDMELRRRKDDAYPGDYRLDLRNTNLQRADIGNLHFEGALFTGARLEGILGRRTKLNGANFTGSNFSGASFVNAKLPGIIFSRCVSINADFNDADLSQSLFMSTIGIGAQFSKANVYDGGFYNSTFIAAKFVRSNLEKCYFWRVGIIGCDFSSANLSHTGLEGSDVRDVKFDRAVLYGANLHGVKSLTAEMVSKAFEGDQDTNLPEDIARPPNWSNKILSNAEIEERIKQRDAKDEEDIFN